MIFIYSKNGCPRCVQAQKLCEEFGAPHRVLKLEAGEFTVQDFVEKFNSRSLPGIVNHDGKVISLEDLTKALS